MTFSKEQLQTFEITLLVPPHEEEEHNGCVSRLLNELVSSPYFARVHFFLAPSHPSNCAVLFSIYSGWFFLSISSLTYPLVGECLLVHPICNNDVVCYKAYPHHATTIVYNPATNIASFFFNPANQNFRILVQNSDFGNSGYSIFNYATGLWKSVANPLQLTYEDSTLCVNRVYYVLEKFIKFDMFALDMISEEWAQIPFPCNSLIEWRSRIPSDELKMKRFCVLLYCQQPLFIVRAMYTSINVAAYDIASKRCKFYRRFFWHPRVHDLACP
ncbi:hypothetical protein AMTRI_Chr08g163730 [Amborella trichopoda]